jgi:hypothetical protein
MAKTWSRLLAKTRLRRVDEQLGHHVSRFFSEAEFASCDNKYATINGRCPKSQQLAVSGMFERSYRHTCSSHMII